VKEINGLESCVDLINLHLSSNSIRQIDGLSKLTALQVRPGMKYGNDVMCSQVLWLNNNGIKKIEGLEFLAALRVLWLCSNEIASIGGSLSSNQTLEELNVSENKISSFRDILNLSRLKSLKSLSFTDPHFGDNPICRLCNYQTYVTYHIPGLQSLDAGSIGENAKRLAKAIYLKKKMYYNMRMKTLKLYGTNIIKRGIEVHSKKVDYIQQTLDSLNRLQKEVLRGNLAGLCPSSRMLLRLEEVRKIIQ